MDSTKAFLAITTPLANAYKSDLNNLKKATTHEWFAKALAQHGLLAYLQYAPPSHAVASMNSLLYAYQHAGTREGLCQLCLGLFGLNSVIIIDETPNDVTLNISNSNSNFTYALANNNLALAHSATTLAGTSIRNLTENDPLAFFKLFLPVGVVLKGLNIS